MREHVSLQPHNTFGLAATARYFAEANSLGELRAALALPLRATRPTLVLGGGSNLLLTGDFDGLVIKINLPGIEITRQDDDHAWVRAGAGVRWHDLVTFAIDHNLGGIENLSLIWGTVGAAPMQNIGAYGVEIQDTFDHLEAVRQSDGEARTFTRAECQFGYRESVFKRALKGQYIITAVTLRLRKRPVFNVAYGDLRATLAQMGVAEADLTVRAVGEAVCRIRTSKLPDPAQVGNAGSFFKNPEISPAQFATLQAAHPAVPHYPAGELVKVPAGWLIEQCGWKGRRVGEAGVHDRQALVLVNYGRATGADLWQLAQQIRDSVQARFGIALQAEVNVV